ncbi:MAG: Gfo/Idh/MocA family oxidoreductase [Armatimonadetes bacterium]|nr:Gfo/Idh/MocA family oxidoreductase [Armatimonadota bacterium]
MSKPVLTVGMIGYQFMGRAHSNAYRQVGRFFDLPCDVRMKTVCGRTESAVKEAADQLGWEGYATDWRAVIADPEIDIIDISTPGNTHCEIAIAAAEAGKIVFCEKPIGNTLDEAERMWAAVEKSGKPSAVFHNYRKAPAVALAKKWVASGKLGEIHHFRARYLQDWIADPEFPMVWRLKKATTGSGALGDIGSHIIDLARHLVGEFSEVCGMTHTFISERPDGQGGRDQVDVDDAAIWMARLGDGTLGSFEASRFAVGRKNHNTFEINGSKGSVVFDLERMNELEYYDNTEPTEQQGFRVIQATAAEHPYAGNFWPSGHIIGYEHTFINLLADAFSAICNDQETSPNLYDGLQNQRVLDAVDRSSESRSWVKI